MSDSVNRFYNSISASSDRSQGELIDLFVYFITIDLGETAATAARIKECFEDCDLTPPTRIHAHLSEGTRSKPAKFVRHGGGYRLQRHMRESLAKELGAETVTVQASVELRRLEAVFPEGPRKAFLSETIDCFEAKANRASVIMCWLLTLDHLYEFILKHKSAEFNSALSKNTDRRIKISCISTRDDFGEIPEGRFIELCRSAGIISNDVRKILDEKLGTRNSAAHPSAIEIRRSKAIEFVEDLVANVVLKYTI